jgi:hypothetical protein
MLAISRPETIRRDSRGTFAPERRWQHPCPVAPRRPHSKEADACELRRETTRARRIDEELDVHDLHMNIAALFA